MWIRERFFDISKRLEAIPYRLLQIIAFFAFSIVATQCVVTDKIEFHDAENMPVSIIEQDPPSDQIISAGNGSKLQFSVIVWDPDIEDLRNPPLSASLTVHTDESINTQPALCDAPKHLEEVIDKDYFKIICRFEVPTDARLQGATIVIELLVSDLGFEHNEEISGDSLTSRVTWNVRVEEGV